MYLIKVTVDLSLLASKMVLCVSSNQLVVTRIFVASLTRKREECELDFIPLADYSFVFPALGAISAFIIKPTSVMAVGSDADGRSKERSIWRSG